MNVVMIYFYSKRFRFAPSFNNSYFITKSEAKKQKFTNILSLYQEFLFQRQKLGNKTEIHTYTEPVLGILI